MKIKTKGLIGPALDWAAALCEGKPITLFCGVMVRNGPTLSTTHADPLVKWSPSTDWSQGGPIIEREWLDVTPWPNESREDMRWHCQQHDSGGDCAQYGPTPLIAAMRCYVTSKIGDEVEVPDALMET